MGQPESSESSVTTLAESSTWAQARSLEASLRAQRITSWEPPAARAKPHAIAPLPTIPSRFKLLSAFG
jgi:hypothetical protein